MPINQSVQYTFNELNELTSVIYGTGQKIVYSYDPAGNPTSVVVEPGAAVQPATCANCGRARTPGRRFCTSCGHPVSAALAERRCPTCRKIVPAGKKFCPDDGTRMPDAQMAAARRCPKCQRVVPAGKKFCTADGTPAP